ncbi:uncharacterized protein IL334_003763 [Kwoniella shivajii]|uniref:RNI-like protein n=1 Tax=Kwoniella shivajii TaxID=564305 RepID=A0ABZ1D061_9TREE|nr:hypothetical protein IL334_003763 [Kwoniella shivajii]
MSGSVQSEEVPHDLDDQHGQQTSASPNEVLSKGSPNVKHQPQPPSLADNVSQIKSEILTSSSSAALSSFPISAADSTSDPLSASSTLSAPLSNIPSSSPAKRRPRPPAKGILKPPPPPTKPTLGNRLRDIVGGAVNTAVGTTSRLFDAPDEFSAAGSSSLPQSSSANLGTSTSAPGGTLASISGRLAGLGLSRFVVNATGPPSNSGSTTSSPLPARSVSLPEAGSPIIGPVGTPISTEKSKQKQPLKRATFVLPNLSITYPISSQGEPWSAKVTEDRRRIETNHRLLLSSSCGPQYWSSHRLVMLYESACRGREERPRVGIVRALEVIPLPPKSRHIHLTLRPVDHTTIGVALPAGSPNTLDAPLTRYAAESFADVLSAEWGLMDLKLENGVIEGEDVLKPILHALLISGTLPSLGLAGNKKIKAGGWRLLATFLKRARSLRYIDLSDTVWDKKSVEYLVLALAPTQLGVEDSSFLPDPSLSPDLLMDNTSTRISLEVNGDGDGPVRDAYGSFIPPAPLLKEGDANRTSAVVQTLRLDGCGLKANVLETLAQGVRSSDLKNISLRRNRIGPLGAVALALMIRDYPDSVLTMSSLSPGLTSSGLVHSPLLGPPSDPASNPCTPTTLPYAARTRKPQPPLPNHDRDLPPIPMIVSSATGGVTSRTIPEGYKPPPPPKHPLVMPGGGNSAMQEAGNFTVSNATAEGRMSTMESGGASIALQRSVRALDGVERIGRLLTLDLKSNEIKNGVSYIAQVLKRNRTLKVLNLSDNRIETSGLVAIAEALKYNSSLETLDLSSNPCCGPSGEGIAALRTAFTVNTSLKRLFLADTGLTNDGAISLAEFLPETKSLLHLDLTNNSCIDTAGILAISVGLKSNKLIRCLDISIPPNSPDLAGLSQNILQSCIRNTELAVESSKSHQEVIWGPIKKSTLVRQVKEADEMRKEQERLALAQSPEGLAREFVYTLRPERVVVVTEETLNDLQKWFEAAAVYKKRSSQAIRWEPGQLPKEEFEELVQRSKVLKERVVDQIQEPSTDDRMLEHLLGLNDMLTNSIEFGSTFVPPPRLLLPSQIVPTESSPIQPQRLYPQRRHMRISSTEISSPNFSIGDSDNDDSDPEEINENSFSQNTPTKSPAKSNRLIASGLGLGSITPIKHKPSISGEEQEEGFLEAQGNEASPITGLQPLTLFNGEDHLDDLTSPTEQTSRAWVEEEGEIFRKGIKLGVVDDEDDNLGMSGEKGEVSGEELRKEILDTPVARSPTRRIINEDGEEDEEADDDTEVPAVEV